MIPVRVLLKNFLSYDSVDGQPVVFDFEGSSLWSITGDNGAGKSAIFDAITYTLYGQHRGGAQQDGRLIRHGASGCEANFEFRVDEELYRVRRTISRPRRAGATEPKTRQAAWYNPALEDWVPIPDTDRDDVLKRWVTEKVGFGYETFIASMLLLQGKSDELVQATAKDRFNILSGLLDLAFYRRLEERIRGRLSDARRDATNLENQLRNEPRITADEERKAAEAATAAEGRFRAAQEALEEARETVREATRFLARSDRLQAIDTRRGELVSVLADAEEIRRDYSEWRFLSDALPLIEAAVADIENAVSAESEANEKGASADEIDLEALEAAAEQTEQRESEANAASRRLRDEHQKLQAPLPVLGRYLDSVKWVWEKERECEAAGDIKLLSSDVEARKAEYESCRAGVEDLRKRRDEAAAGVAAAETDLSFKQGLFDQRIAAGEEGVCSRCGQKVDAAHLQRELDQARRDLDTARTTMEEKKAEATEVDSLLKEASTRLTVAEAAANTTRDALSTATRLASELERALAASAEARVAAKGAFDVWTEAEKARTPDEVDKVQLSISSKLEGVHESVKAAEADQDTARRSASDARGRLSQQTQVKQRLEGESKLLGERASALRGQAGVRVAAVADRKDWYERALAGDRELVDELKRRTAALNGTESRHADLQNAEEELARLNIERRSVEREIAEIDPRHRIEAEEAQEREESAKSDLDAATGERDSALAAVRDLERRKADLEQKENELAKVRKRHSQLTHLAELLGRSGIQAHILRSAANGISLRANETLSRISGGQLQLSIQEKTNARGDEEMFVEVTDSASSDEPLDVQFISGSQKFRTSVALAVGIGQYVGGAVRSLIIDEGFGSLDSQGRQEMIEEIRSLSQLEPRRFDRIIVVSHQEDFQDRTLFPTGYVLRKRHQRTEVERVI